MALLRRDSVTHRGVISYARYIPSLSQTDKLGIYVTIKWHCRT